MEKQFIEDWTELTRMAQRKFGSSVVRLYRDENGDFVSIAEWSSARSWQRWKEELANHPFRNKYRAYRIEGTALLSPLVTVSKEGTKTAEVLSWWKLVRQASLMSEEQLLVLFEQTEAVAHLPGDVAELGVYRGGSAVLLAGALPDKMVHAFESFKGLTNLGSFDKMRTRLRERGHAPNDYKVADLGERKQIRERLAASGICLHEGDFSSESKKISGIKFCLAHFDGDTYESARAFMQFFCPRLLPGGRMIIDDYKWVATPGVKRAVDEFCNPKFKIESITTGQAIIKNPHR